ncbi:MAG: hypothetical protein ACI81L_002870 [Verrucomicrobiales bacterium]|jgi:hypothetical protein
MIEPMAPRLLTATQIDETADSIVEWQLPSGMIPWVPGGHADPWNHVEAAMALASAGQIEHAERAYDWLVSKQLDDGSWHQYYTADGVEQDKFDANVIAYVATGVWHHWLVSQDHGFAEAMFPVVEKAIDWIFELQQERGEILWARHGDGTPWSFALLTGSSSMYLSSRAALALSRIVGADRSDWIERIDRLGEVLRTQPDGAFAPKTRWAMDWYYPVLSGALQGDAARDRLASRFETFVMPRLGVRCVGDRPWVTTAETCECAMAHLSIGDRSTAEALFDTTWRLRGDSGRYWTGEVHPEEVHFPGGEMSTYSSAAVLLANDALANHSRAASVFTDHDELPV